MCRLRSIAMRDYEESLTTGQTDRHGGNDGQTDAGQIILYSACWIGQTDNIGRQWKPYIFLNVVQFGSFWYKMQHCKFSNKKIPLLWKFRMFLYMGSQNGILSLILKSRRLFVKPLFREILKKAACVICHFIRKILTHTFIEENSLSVKCGFLLGSAHWF